MIAHPWDKHGLDNVRLSLINLPMASQSVLEPGRPFCALSMACARHGNGGSRKLVALSSVAVLTLFGDDAGVQTHTHMCVYRIMHTQRQTDRHTHSAIKVTYVLCFRVSLKKNV